MNVHRQVKSELRFLVFSAIALAVGYFVFVYPHTNDFGISDKECEELTRYWKSGAEREFQLGDGWKDFNALTCPSNKASLLKSIRFIERLELDIAGKEAAITYHQWAVNLKPLFAQSPLFGLAGRTRFDERIIDLSPILLEKANWVQIAGVIVHELRHLEQGINTHVPCRADSGLTCDRRLDLNPQTGDAYSYNMLFLHQVRLSSTATRYEKTLAKREMQRIFDVRFNQVDPDLHKTLKLKPKNQ